MQTAFVGSLPAAGEGVNARLEISAPDPATVFVEQLVGRGIVGGFQAVALLGQGQIQRQELLAAAALLRAVLFPFMGQEMVQRGEQEGAEPAAVGVGAGDGVALQEPGEEFLGQVLGVRRRMATPAHVSVKGIPVGLAKPGQGILCASGIRVAGDQDYGPMRGQKPRT